MSLRSFLFFLGIAGATPLPLSEASALCSHRLAINNYNMKLINEWMRYDENERIVLKHDLAESEFGVLGYGDPTLKSYRRRLYSDLHSLYDGNFIALIKTISQKQLTTEERDPQFNGASREVFFKNLNEWCDLKLTPAPNKARIIELEALLKNEYTMHNSTSGSFQPIVADLGNMLSGLTKESEIDSDFPRHGLPALFCVFYERFLLNPSSSAEENHNVNDFVRRHFSP